MNVSMGSGKKVWWLCNKCKNEWQASIYSRSYGKGCPYCSSVVLKDGERCASLVEAYFYLLYKEMGIEFRHDKKYGREMGNKRYDFYFPEEDRYIEVTGFTKRSRNYITYLRNIVIKKKYVQNALGAKFEFLYKKLSYENRRVVEENIKTNKEEK